MTGRFSDKVAEVSVQINQNNEVFIFGMGGRGDESFVITIGDATLLGYPRCFASKREFDSVREELTKKAQKVFKGRTRKFIREFSVVMDLISDVKTKQI